MPVQHNVTNWHLIIFPTFTNHDLEGLHEFKTDADNLGMVLHIHNKQTPQFCREIANKTLLVGLSSISFRGAKYISHEVVIDQVQIDWFENLLQQHSAKDGWRVIVFSHAPIIGSGLNVLQENQVVDGCCWLNHNNDKSRNVFIDLVREHSCIKAWFSGHFHLCHDYQDSIKVSYKMDSSSIFIMLNFSSLMLLYTQLPDVNGKRGQCTFIQTSVMSSRATRDGYQQSRLLRGNQNGFDICTVDHQKNGEVRVDATVRYEGDTVVTDYVNDGEKEMYEYQKYRKIVKYHIPSNGDDHMKSFNDKGIIERKLCSSVYLVCIPPFLYSNISNLVHSVISI